AASSGETSSPLTALMGALAGPIPSTTAKAGETSGISILAPFTDNWTFFAAEREAPANRHDAVAVAPHHDVAAHTDTVGAPALDTAPSVSKISAESPTPATQSQTSLLHQAWSNGDTIDTTGKVGATPQQLRQAMDQTAASGDGKGIKIGLLSDSFDFLKGADADKASGALPSSVEILKEGTSGIDEGRAMLQIVHTIAPGASLAFYSSPGSEQDFADGIRKLADAGCKVICDDIFYYHEPMFQNGPIAKAIQEVVAKGVTYVTLAGNNDGAGYQGAWKGVSGAYGGMTFNNAMSFNGSIVQNITVDPKPGSETPLLLWWDEAYGQAKANLQIHVFQDGKWQGTTNHIRFGVPNDPWTEYFFDKPGTYQVVTPPPGSNQPECLVQARQGSFDYKIDPQVQSQVTDLLLAGKDRQAYVTLLTAYFQLWSKAMPAVFPHANSWVNYLAPGDLLSATSVRLDIVQAMDQDACKDVEVIGWLYQYYISQVKAEINDSKKKITAKELAPVTQLFTPHWIVRYLVENTVGKQWLRAHPSSPLREQMEYLVPSAQGQEDAGLAIGDPTEFRIVDPACGSAHMLTYTFDLLWQMYVEAGYSSSKIANLIFTHNLTGIEIDRRAVQLASFALAMK
ncbi:MAG: hypothetical protein E6833_29430, partial [Bradyrhizobium sp.]|nr:hypothetical protein [Bradyrhizobium sp.]